MPTYNLVPVDKLTEPLNPMRVETLMEHIDELRASIHENGLQEPIGVKALADGSYRIMYGHRRAICVTQLKWDFVPAMVYLEDEGNEDVLMASENLHRFDANPAEEARLWKRLLPGDAEGTIGLARRYHVPESRIQRLLICEQGDPEVFRLMGEGKLSLAQAYTINQFESQGYRLHAIELCTKEGWGADRLDRWRKDLKTSGVDLSHDVVPVDWSRAQQFAPQEAHDICNIGNHSVPILQRRVWGICDGHVDVVIQGMGLVGQLDIIEQAGYLPEFKALLRKAERALDDGNRIDTD